jgi:arylsulfatase A-like enzyme
MMTPRLRVAIGALLVAPLSLAAGIVFETDFNSAFQAAADQPVHHGGLVADGFEVSAFTKGPGLGAFRLDDQGQADEEDKDLWVTEPAGTNNKNLADAVANGAYIEFTITADEPTRITAIEFSMRGHGNVLDGYATLRSSVDDFASDLGTAAGPLNTKSSVYIVLDALGGFRALTGVTFRFYLYNEYVGQNNRRIGVDDIVVHYLSPISEESLFGPLEEGDDGSWLTQDFGAFTRIDGPWYHHESAGWLFVHPDRNRYWVFSVDTGWMYFDSRWLPWVWKEAVGWRYFLEGQWIEVTPHKTGGAPEGAPNIVLVMLDDMGFSDIGSYGGEIETPVLDRLADQGLRLTRFSATPKCHSSRISLLTGLWSEQAGSFGMRHGVTIAELLRARGYATWMTGKWHLNNRPTDRGFERYFGHLSGASDFIEGNDSYLLDEEPYADFGRTADEFYLTDANTDFAIEFLRQRNAEADLRPFFLYMAYNAPHSPLQAPEPLVRKYLGRYMEGWESIHAARFERQKERGLFPEDLDLPPWPEHHRRWEDLTPLEKEWEDYRMAIYAAMMESVDINIGRLVDEIETMGEWENTVFLFLSDNGANAFERSGGLRVLPWEAGCRMNVGTEWAAVSNTPWLWYKQNTFGGGVATPLVIHWPEGLQAHGWSDAPSHIVDIYPTLLDVIGIEYPSSFGQKDTVGLVGQSLFPVVSGSSFHRTEPIWYNFRNNAALRMDGWKLISFKNGPWELYDIGEDPLETVNIASLHPDRVASMGELWYHIAEEVNRAPLRQWTPRLEEPIAWGVDAEFDGENWVPTGPLSIEMPPEWPDYRPPVYGD